MSKPFLKRVSIKGFKSIKEADIELRPLNVLIGANGAGKSNFISFFKMLNEMASQRFQSFVAASGRAQSLLHYSAKITPQLEAECDIETQYGLCRYLFQLRHVPGDTLAFASEKVIAPNYMRHYAAGKFESLMSVGLDGELQPFFSKICVYQFHDTTATARIRQYFYRDDNCVLAGDGGNLAPFLFKLRERKVDIAYRRIVDTIRLVAPFFGDFDFSAERPDAKDVILNWRERDSATLFGPHQLSDGTLRAMALIALLQQPEDELPPLIVIDEPELGLHPYALNVVASLIAKASHDAQIVISTQSSALIDSFEPEDVIVVDREEKASTFKRLSTTELASWLEEYSLGEIWEKNVVGGGPH